MNITLTLIIVAITCLTSYQAFNNIAMRQKLIFHPYTVKQNGEWYRFISHGFIHADWMHLGINMFVLYQFGGFIEYKFMDIFGQLQGKLFYLALYFGAIIAGGIPSYFKHQTNSYYSALGASGGTSGIVFAFILFDPWKWFLYPPLPAVLFGIAYLFYSSYMGKKGRDNIGHDAHFWGAIFGFVLTITLAATLNTEILQEFVEDFLKGPRAFGT